MNDNNERDDKRKFEPGDNEIACIYGPPEMINNLPLYSPECEVKEGGVINGFELAGKLPFSIPDLDKKNNDNDTN
ncbi:MAG: hypothetical protein K6G75_00520 [Lachnospiraceae bacterium]|nr:hypothetical protein [Lachnospiraceae bacterium]